jgi:competence protein ComEC
LHPDTTWAGWGTDLNEDSIVLRVRAGRFEAVLGGDAGLPVESLLRGRVGRAEVLKVGHHGSRTATGSRWLAEIRPSVAVVSVGANRYGHPAPAALARLDSAGADVWRTDREGTITVVVESSRMQVRGRNRAVWYPLD